MTSRLELQTLVRAARRGSRAEQSDLDCRSEALSWAQEEVRRAGVRERARQRVRCYKRYARSRSQLALENPVSPKAHSLEWEDDCEMLGSTVRLETSKINSPKQAWRRETETSKGSPRLPRGATWMGREERTRRCGLSSAGPAMASTQRLRSASTQTPRELHLVLVERAGVVAGSFFSNL